MSAVVAAKVNISSRIVAVVILFPTEYNTVYLTNTASINCCKKTFYCNDHKIMELGITDKNSSTAYIVLYKWIDT